MWEGGGEQDITRNISCSISVISRKFGVHFGQWSAPYLRASVKILKYFWDSVCTVQYVWDAGPTSFFLNPPRPEVIPARFLEQKCFFFIIYLLTRLPVLGTRVEVFWVTSSSSIDVSLPNDIYFSSKNYLGIYQRFWKNLTFKIAFLALIFLWQLADSPCCFCAWVKIV